MEKIAPVAEYNDHASCEVFTDARVAANGETPARARPRIAFIVSHPIQYFAPLHQRLALRSDVQIKVFFTWHAGGRAVRDSGFRIPVAWDIPLTEGYDFEAVPNRAADPGTHHFRGLWNPTLVRQVMAWRPDVVHITGWAWQSHFMAMRAFAKCGVPFLFRGDSHLLDDHRHGPRWWIKSILLRWIFSWPAAFLVVGAANRAYYETFGVTPDRLFFCPHSVDVRRFAEPAAALEEQAAGWRRKLGIKSGKTVLLYAGKFEPKKRPVDLMRAVLAIDDPDLVLILVGDGELREAVEEVARLAPERFRIVPFQNQSRMPVVYRLGDIFVLPSAYGETWGLAVNEAMASGRPVLLSDRVGCGPDVVDPSCGRVFSWIDPQSFTMRLWEMTADRAELVRMGNAATKRAWSFDIGRTEAALVDAVRQVFER
ncbi:MAG TPA: glycosyltransferase family 4 protein [Xanthobacteraceae bacterium]|nr:glycosyltransferase family 4 protein [Xanthobacteraceae bacterium]